jgi:hypothetical protein
MPLPAPPAPPAAPLVTPEEGRSFLVKWRAERKAKESPNG